VNEPDLVTEARFISPMLLQRVSSLPEGPDWVHEVKLARAVARPSRA